MPPQVLISTQWQPMREVQYLMDTTLAANGGRLVLREFIGKGAYGSVFRGTWRNTDVAVKV